MAKRQFAGAGEDAQALNDAYNNALAAHESNIAPLRASDMIMEFGGDRGALARALAGLPASGKISSFSKGEQSQYKTQYKNIDRWLRYEAGDRSKQARDITRSKATQGKIKDLFARRNPPRGNVTATITGWIGYDNQWRYRSVSIPALGKSVDSQAFIAAMQAGNTALAYQTLFAAYAPGLTVAQADDFDLQIGE